MSRLVALLMSAGSLLVASGSAQAQSTVLGDDVANRTHPEYAPRAFPVGSFNVFPSVTAGVNATDNLRASPTNKTSSAYFTLRPEVNARSTWARHSLGLSAYLDTTVHPKLTTENVTTFGGAVNGLYDISRQTQFQFNLAGARAAESRFDLGSLRGSTRPVKLNQYVGQASLSQGFGKVSVQAGGSVERRTYQTAWSGNLPIDQSYRDLTLYGASLDLKYDLGNGVGLIGSARYNHSVYDFRPGHRGFVSGVDIDRQSSGYSLLGGFTLELSKLVFGTIRVGYLKQNYRDPRLNDPHGFNLDVDLLWNVSTLTSVRLRASRHVIDTSSLLTSGTTLAATATRTDVGIGVSHELYRNLLLQADGSYAHFGTRGTSAEGDEYGAGLGLRYLLNNNITVKARVDHSERHSTDPGLRYKSNRGYGTVGYAF